MDDKQIRLACLDAAVRTAGNPNHIQQAREYYAFVTEAREDEAPATKADIEVATKLIRDVEPPATPLIEHLESSNTPAPQKGQKGNRK
jgi:hypothetical protein